MNNRQKLVLEQFLDNEEAVIKRLKQVYNKSLKDITAKAKELQDQINTLDALEGMASDPKELAKLQSMKQAKVYQKQYQDALKKQVSSILDNMQVEEFKTVSEYLNKCYEEGFLGTMYDLQGQGIPLCFPMDQESMVRAVQLDSKISHGLYTRLGEDVALLKKKITAQVSRGISTGMSFQQVAQQLASYTNIGYNNAVRITRTEGHRIQVQSGMDACYKAKDMGADVVKQWDSTLDGKTRDSHQQVDGEIRELDEKFSNGLMFPGDPSGRAEEVVNCRCALLQRARWALDNSFKKYDNFSGELKEFENDDSYKAFKKDYFSKENVRYMKHVEELEEKYGTKNFNKVLSKMNDAEYKHFKKLEKARPSFDGMYQGQNVIRIKAAGYDDFKKEYLKAVDLLKISFPDDCYKINGFTEDVKKEVDEALTKLNNEYDIRLNSIVVEPAGKRDIFMTGYHDGVVDMAVNENIDFENVISEIKRNHASRRYAGKSLEDYVAHEMAHCMLYQDCTSDAQYRAKFNQIEALYDHLQGISGYADKLKSGNEALAEAFVRVMNNETVSPMAKVLVKSYFGKWKK